MAFGIAHPHSRLITKAIKSDRETERKKEIARECIASNQKLGKLSIVEKGGKEMGEEGR